MYELTRVRLRSVGPWGARFDDVIMDLSKPWDDKLGIEEHAPDSNHELHAHPARSTAIFGKNGVGKSTLLRLISSVLAGNRPRRGPRYVSHAPSDDIGHIALEWRDLRTGSQLITGRVVRPHPDKMIGMSAGFYSFQSGETITLDTLPFEGAGSSEKVSSFRERLHAAFETGAGLTWVRSRVEWKKHLRDCGFNVHWFQWIVDHLLFDRVVQDWTEERFLEFVLREAVPGELLARLESLEGEYLNLRRRGSEVEDVLQESKKREMAELLDKIFEEALAIMADVQRLSRFPESVRSELGGCELFRVNLHRKSREQHVERLVEFLDDLTGKTEGDRILLRGLQKTQDISVEICVQSRPETGPPRYVPFAKVNRFPGQAAVMGRLFLMPLIGFAVARLAMSRDGELSGRFGPKTA